MGWTAIRLAALTPTPWPNGRGVTRDYLVRQGGALRITLADLAEDAPFSHLPGLHRVFTVAKGGPVELTVDGVATVVAPLHPFHFEGGAETTCRLLDGPGQAFNLFYDPVSAHADVNLVQDAAIDAAEHVLFCPSSASVDGISLGAGDAAIGRGPVRVDGAVLAVRIAP